VSRRTKRASPARFLPYEPGTRLPAECLSPDPDPQACLPGHTALKPPSSSSIKPHQRGTEPLIASQLDQNIAKQRKPGHREEHKPAHRDAKVGKAMPGPPCTRRPGLLKYRLAGQPG
jgi:hypothetical protein